MNRFVVDEADGDAFTSRASAALSALAVRPGYLRGSLGRSYDDPRSWSLVTEWESVGAYRRALSAFEVRVAAVPLLSDALDEPSAYEELVAAGPGGELRQWGSDRAPGAGPLPSPP